VSAAVTAISRGRRWAVSVVAIALPAIASPLLFVPINSPLPRSLLLASELLLGHPRWWATVATLLAVFGARQFAASRFQEGAVAVAVILAWSLGCDTVAIIDHLF